MNLKLLVLEAALLPMSAIAQAINIFDVDGIKYQEIEPVASNPKEVMVCSPKAEGREYDFPFTEEGEINIPQEVSHDGVVYAVTAIENGAFFQEPRLKNVTLPPSIVSVGIDNFSECGNLQSLDLSKVTLSHELSLMSCPALKTLILPEKQLTSLEWSFLGDYGLESLYLPETLDDNTLFLACFLGVKSIATIYCQSENPPRFDSGKDGPINDEFPANWYLLFGNNNLWQNQPVIYVPDGSVDAYKESDSWYIFNDIREYDYSGTLEISPDHGKTPRFKVVGNGIVSEDGASFDVYDMSGRKVGNRNLLPGIYIVHQDGCSQKINLAY